jgi:hypothetical protein
MHATRGDGIGHARRRAAARRCATCLRVAALAAIALCLAAGPAFAAHPLITEDTGTQGRGKFELELGSALTHDGNGHTFELDPQLSLGATDALDLIVRPSLFELSGQAADDAGRHAGFGGTALDAKWRFYEAGALSVGTRAGLDLPTATRGLGPRHTGAHALVAVTWDGPLWLSGNVAYTRRAAAAEGEAQSRRDAWRVSLALAHALGERLRLVGDVAAAQADDPGVSGMPAVALVGAIVKLTEHVDMDVGYQKRLSRDAPPNAWLGGITFRW